CRNSFTSPLGPDVATLGQRLPDVGAAERFTRSAFARWSRELRGMRHGVRQCCVTGSHTEPTIAVQPNSKHMSPSGTIGPSIQKLATGQSQQSCPAAPVAAQLPLLPSHLIPGAASVPPKPAQIGVADDSAASKHAMPAREQQRRSAGSVVVVVLVV